MTCMKYLGKIFVVILDGLQKLEFDKLSVSHCISIGFIFKKTQKYLWIFSSYEINDLGEINFGDRTVIPLSNITKMEKIWARKNKKQSKTY